MQSEKIEFTFKLGLINIYSPIPIKIMLNDQLINELNLGPNSNSINFIADMIDGEKYTLAFKVEEISRPSRIIINNLNVCWLDNNRTLNPAWRAPSSNEIWDYADSTATKRHQHIVRKVQNIDLDYFVAGNPGYLKRFAYFENADGNVTAFNNLERPFAITEPGSFKFDFTTPISYWLLQRLA